MGCGTSLHNFNEKNNTTSSQRQVLDVFLNRFMSSKSYQNTKPKLYTLHKTKPLCNSARNKSLTLGEEGETDRAAVKQLRATACKNR